jgi:DNA-binding XRE family transcriptional regulator
LKMRREKKERLEAAGWRVGTVEEFLELTPEEAEYVDMKVNLSRFLRERRKNLALTQAQVAQQIGSSQSRVAKLEAADPSVTLDLLVRSALALGASAKELAEALAGASG